MTKLVDKFLLFVDETQHSAKLVMADVKFDMFCAANGYSDQTRERLLAKLRSMGVL